MKRGDTTLFDKQVYYRLVALWIFCEAVLGGIIHGLKLPVSGLVVGSCSVICICLIGRYVPLRHAILKATIIVAIFKMMLSPHAPPTAYVAVFFQGLVGQLFLGSGRFYGAGCILFGAIALAESALQRILVMTVVFGNDIWKAINETISKLTGQTAITDYSLWIGTGYLALHIFVGIAVGMFAFRLTKHKTELIPQYVIENDPMNEKPVTRKNKTTKFIFIAWLILLMLFLQSELSIGAPVLSSTLPVQIILRSLLILLTWYFVVSPLLLYVVRKWLLHLKEKQAKDIEAVAQLIPSTKSLVYTSWKLSAGEKGFRRIKTCCKIILLNTLRQHA